MLNPVYTRRFEKDVKLMKRRGKNLEKLKVRMDHFVEALEKVKPSFKRTPTVDYIGLSEKFSESAYT